MSESLHRSFNQPFVKKKNGCHNIRFFTTPLSWSKEFMITIYPSIYRSL